MLVILVLLVTFALGALGVVLFHEFGGEGSFEQEEQFIEVQPLAPVVRMMRVVIADGSIW